MGVLLGTALREQRPSVYFECGRGGGRGEDP